MRLPLLLTVAASVVALTGCEQSPPGLDMSSFDAPEFEAPTNDEYGPLLPAEPDGPGRAPDPEVPGEVTAYCHGGGIVDYNPKTPEAHARAQGICADQETYDQYGFAESDPFDNSDQFHGDLQDWLDRQ